MTIPEEFIIDHKDSLSQNPFKIFHLYNYWLKKQYIQCQSDKYRERLQEEASKFTNVYMDAICKLFGIDRKEMLENLRKAETLTTHQSARVTQVRKSKTSFD